MQTISDENGVALAWIEIAWVLVNSKNDERMQVCKSMQLSFLVRSG